MRSLSKTVLTAAFALVSFAAVSSAAEASQIIISENKSGVVSPTANAVSGSNDLQTITPHAAWQTNNPLGRGAAWVSNADTGYGGSVFQSRSLTGGGDAVADIIFTITETIAVVTASSLEFTIWADDTARVSFDGTVKKGPNFTQNTCADGPISCEPHESFTFTETFGPGTYDIVIDTYQIGTGTTTSANPFGVLYSGEVTSVPVPATLALMGAGLLGLGIAGRRRQKA